MVVVLYQIVQSILTFMSMLPYVMQEKQTVICAFYLHLFQFIQLLVHFHINVESSCHSKAASKQEGPKKFGVPEKKAVFFLIKGLLFSRVPQIFFGPSYFEAALAEIKIFLKKNVLLLFLQKRVVSPRPRCLRPLRFLQFQQPCYGLSREDFLLYYMTEEKSKSQTHLL